ncbi:MAG: nucleotide sugar dehydrogenase [Thermoplasmata archaeon]
MTGRKICVIGCTERGIRAAVLLAACGHRVALVDENRKEISRIARGDLPFYDREIATELSKAVLRKRIVLSDSVDRQVKNSDYVFLASETEASKSGIVGLAKLRRTIEKVGASLGKGSTVVMLSRVPPGTSEDIVSEIAGRKSGLRRLKNLSLAACRIMPEKIVIGASSRRIGEELASLFDSSKFEKAIVHIKSAEAVDFLDGCALANEIGFSNELANLCEKLGVDAHEVLPLIGVDSGNIGLGYGNPEISSDVSSTLRIGKKLGVRLDILRAVEKANRRQAIRAVELLRNAVGSLKGKRIALLGLATHAGTISVEGSRAFDIAVSLLAEGAKVVGYDRLAMSEFIKVLPEISLAASAREALLDADGCIIQTDDSELRRLTKQDFDLMRNKIVIDGRRILSAAKMEKSGVSYRAIGLGREARDE